MLATFGGVLLIYAYMNPLIGTGVGAATSLASSIIGAISSAKANKRANNLINTQRQENRDWYNNRMSQDYTKRSDNQAILKKQKEMLDAYYNRAQAGQAVSGGTDEAVAMQKAAANASLADTMTNMAAQSSSYKDAIEQQYRAQDAALNQQQVGAQQNKAAQTAAAAAQGVSAGLNLFGSAMGMGVEKKDS